MIAERARDITRALIYTDRQHRSATPSRQPVSKDEAILDHFSVLLENSIRTLGPERQGHSRRHCTYTYYSSLFSEGVGTPTLTKIVVLEINLPGGGMAYVTGSGELADRGMMTSRIRPLKPRDFMFRYGGNNGHLSKDDAYLNELIQAIRDTR